jgi:hypothetical protein
MKFEQGRREGNKGLEKTQGAADSKDSKERKGGGPRKEGRKRESGEEPAQPHVNPSVPTLFSSLFRRPFVHNNPVQRSAAPLPARLRRTVVDDETDLSRPLTGVEDRTAPSQRRRTWWFVRLRTGMNDNFPWSSLAGTNISTRSATNSRY